MKILLCSSFFMVLIFSKALGQSAYIPFNRDYYHVIERYEILEGEFSDSFHTGFKPFRRDHVASYAESLKNSPEFSRPVDQFNLNYLLNDSWEFMDDMGENSDKPDRKLLYNKPADFFHYRDSVFDLHVNPVIYFLGGLESSSPELRFRNTRGMEIRGSVDRKIGFYTYLSTTDLRFPSWVNDYARHHGAVPGEGFWKRYNQDGYSFFSAMGHITFQATDHIQVQMGQDRNFVGEGYRSMILSDFSNPYMFFKVNTKIWKLNLTNMWAQMNADIHYDRGVPTDGHYPQKWFSHHRLGMNLGNNFNFGVFESVMANRFDWNYLNPLIFYRWVEHQLGSPDKVMMGTDFKWNMGRGMQLYGQFVLDEFVFNEFFGIDGKNSSRNKHGIQLGYKYINLGGIANVDLQLEYNQARPFTYQEKFDHQSFTNYRTPLTHPLGANFRECIAIIRYQPLPRLNILSTVLYQLYGTDPDENSNYGGEILKNRTHTSTGLFGNVIGQGVENRVLLGTLHASYMLNHNFFVDFSHTYRRQNAGNLPAAEGVHYGQVSFRMNIGRFDFHY